MLNKFFLYFFGVPHLATRIECRNRSWHGFETTSIKHWTGIKPRPSDHDMLNKLQYPITAFLPATYPR